MHPHVTTISFTWPTEDTERPIMYSADKMSGPKADGSWYADRYDDIIFGEVYNPAAWQICRSLA